MPADRGYGCRQQRHPRGDRNGTLVLRRVSSALVLLALMGASSASAFDFLGIKLFEDQSEVDAEAVIREHTGILNAIRDGDAAAAELQMQRHVERARDLILGWLKTQPGQSVSKPGQ